MIDFNNKHILVVGASSGIGAQTAITLSECGAKVTLVARREEKLKETLSKMQGSGHSYYCADVSNIPANAELIKKIVEEQGKLDGLVFSVGITDNCPMNLLTHEKLVNIFNVNFFPFIDLARHVSKKGRFNEGMRIVALSSVSANFATKAHLAYSAAKAAINASIRCMAKELAPKKIYVNAVSPSFVNTGMTSEFIMKNGEDSPIVQSMFIRQYLGLGETEDIANAICFLLSPEARFITGTVLNVDGGYSGSD